jgi:RNA polymerase sigma-70 factor (ECF subfamily)
METLPGEPQLIARFRAGDASAFERIMEHYEPYVFGLIWRLTGDRGTSEDLCQETFLKVLKGLSKFREASGLKTWIHRVAHNTALDHLRGRRLQPMPQGDDGAVSMDPPDTAGGPDGELAESQLRDAVERAMVRLPTNYREVLHLHYWEGMGVEEIASVLGEPPGTVKTHLFRARKAMREMVEGLAPGGSHAMS